MDAGERLERYARLTVEIGCNLQPGQVLASRPSRSIFPSSGRSRQAAYELGAHYVEAAYGDNHAAPGANRARAGGDTRLVAALVMLAKSTSSPTTNGALVSITGDPDPELLADLDRQPHREGAPEGAGGEACSADHG